MNTMCSHDIPDTRRALVEALGAALFSDREDAAHANPEIVALVDALDARFDERARAIVAEAKPAKWACKPSPAPLTADTDGSRVLVAEEPECIGPFASAFDCPACDPRKKPSPAQDGEGPDVSGDDIVRCDECGEPKPRARYHTAHDCVRYMRRCLAAERAARLRAEGASADNLDARKKAERHAARFDDLVVLLNAIAEAVGAEEIVAYGETRARSEGQAVRDSGILKGALDLVSAREKAERERDAIRDAACEADVRCWGPGCAADPEERERVAQRLRRLIGYPVPNVLRDLEAERDAAYARGAEEMRERAATLIESHTIKRDDGHPVILMCHEEVAVCARIRALPLTPPAAAAETDEGGRWGVWCHGEGWCPRFAPRFEGTELEARRELDHWVSGERANIKYGVARYEVRRIPATEKP